MTRKYIGTAGHFIGASGCCFRLHTEVNGPDGYRVSTVGCYHPRGESDGKPQQVGYRRLFESFVFKLSGGEPDGWSEIDSLPSNNEDDAAVNHEALCAKYEAEVKS